MGVTTDPDNPGLREIEPSGMQKTYLILSEQERAKGFVRPVRRSYIHLRCGAETAMGQELAETYARNPAFYGGTFCVTCGAHFNLLDPDGARAFIWVPNPGETIATEHLGVGS